MNANSDSDTHHNPTKDLHIRLTDSQARILMSASNSLLFWSDFIGAHVADGLHDVERLNELGFLIEIPDTSGWKATYAGNCWLYVNGYMCSLLEVGS